MNITEKDARTIIDMADRYAEIHAGDEAMVDLVKRIFVAFPDCVAYGRTFIESHDISGHSIYAVKRRRGNTGGHICMPRNCTYCGAALQFGDIVTSVILPKLIRIYCPLQRCQDHVTFLRTIHERRHVGQRVEFCTFEWQHMNLERGDHEQGDPAKV